MANKPRLGVSPFEIYKIGLSVVLDKGWEIDIHKYLCGFPPFPCTKRIEYKHKDLLLLAQLPDDPVVESAWRHVFKGGHSYFLSIFLSEEDPQKWKGNGFMPVELLFEAFAYLEPDRIDEDLFQKEWYPNFSVTHDINWKKELLALKSELKTPALEEVLKTVDKKRPFYKLS